jgi:hypothetical protein
MWPVMQAAVQQLNAVAIVSSDVTEIIRLILIVFLERSEPLRLHPV